MNQKNGRQERPGRRALRAPRALISVYDKTGIDILARDLAACGVEIIATGGTAQSLREAGLDVKEVAEITSFPEMMDGRVKTLHPKIHGGILARRDLAHHLEAMSAHDIAPIDFLIVNLYPFAETLASGASQDECIEQIDIGAPAMIRGAAKNHAFVTVIVDAQDYALLSEHLKNHSGETDPALRRALAQKAFAWTSAYDAHIAQWLAETSAESVDMNGVDMNGVDMNGVDMNGADMNNVPYVIAGHAAQKLRYGENPHQRGALFSEPEIKPGTKGGIAHARQVQGKALSYNNLSDADAAWALVQEFSEPAAAIIKHANPCGAALGEDVHRAYQKALAADPISAFGGIVAVNQKIDAALAEKIIEIFTECVIAPDAGEDALSIFSRKKNLRVLFARPSPSGQRRIHSISGGFLVQDDDVGKIDQKTLRAVGARAPGVEEQRDMLFAWVICKYAKSNAIVLAHERATCGIGAGQMSRVDAAQIAVNKTPDKKAVGKTKNLVAASDAFFPFPDGVALLAQAGVSAIIQPGGSMRDDEVIAEAKKHDIAMWLTGMRHFRH